MYSASVLVVLVLFTAARSALACSPPEGGFVEPGPEDIVSFSDIVAVGEVTEILPLDPIYGDMYQNWTYGAMVNVFCTYKGGPLGAKIKIGGAGFVPGNCFSKNLDRGQQYVLFLQNETAPEVHEQSNTAVPRTKLGDFLGVCDLHVQYPVVGGMVIKQTECPPATMLSTCKRHDSAPSKAMAQQPDVTTQAAGVVPEKGATTRGKGSGAESITSSLTFLVFLLTNIL